MNISNLLLNKSEYNQELLIKCKPLFKQGLSHIYQIVLSKNNSRKYILRDFQDELAKIPQWNQLIIEKEYKRFVNNTNCEWLDKLISATLLSNAQMLSVNSEQHSSKINIYVPKSCDFIHACYINVARDLWKKPYLLYHKHHNDEFIINNNTFEEIIENNILVTIRQHLPIEKIVDNFLNSTDNVEQKKSFDDKFTTYGSEIDPHVKFKEHLNEQSIHQVVNDNSSHPNESKLQKHTLRDDITPCSPLSSPDVDEPIESELEDKNYIKEEQKKLEDFTDPPTELNFKQTLDKVITIQDINDDNKRHKKYYHNKRRNVDIKKKMNKKKIEKFLGSAVSVEQFVSNKRNLLKYLLLKKK